MPMIYYTLTGQHVENPLVDNDTTTLRKDYPHIGAAVARLRPPVQEVPGFVAMLEVMTRSNGSQGGSGTAIRGRRSDFLSAAGDPLCINGDPRLPDSITGLVLPADVSPDRFNLRDTVRAALDGQSAESTAARNFDELRRTDDRQELDLALISCPWQRSSETGFRGLGVIPGGVACRGRALAEIDMPVAGRSRLTYAVDDISWRLSQEHAPTILAALDAHVAQAFLGIERRMGIQDESVMGRMTWVAPGE